jgi:tRNA pseudouridine38-40 synthase
MTNEQEKLKRYKCIVAYDGTNYAGFQLQENAYTIQEAIEHSLLHIHKEQVKIYASGRTDAGVHAKGQVFHFDSKLDIPNQKWTRAINSGLKPDIRIQETVEVPSDFHSRFDVQKKEYRYVIQQGRIVDPFRRLYSFHVPLKLDLPLMQEAATSFIGEHDFTAFSSIKSVKENKVRTLYQLEVSSHKDEIVITCVGSGFLHSMVRMIVGTLVQVGQGKMPVKQIVEAIERKDRTLVGTTAPAQGLFLWRVSYGQNS